MKFERLRLSWAFIAVVTIIDQVTIRNINLIVRCDRPRYIRDIPSQSATIIRHTFHPYRSLNFPSVATISKLYQKYFYITFKEFEII